MIAFVISVIVIAASTEYALSTIRPSWVFRGAYAELYGIGHLANGTAFTGNETFAVIDYNSTYAKVLVTVNFSSTSRTVVNQTTIWKSIHGRPKVDPLSTGQYANRSYQTTILVNGKNVTVSAYVYKTKVSNGTSESIVYLKDDAYPPIGISLSSDEARVNLLLVKSNIPGLIP